MNDAVSAKAALYLRSSKDRSDVSPAAQRRALEALASSRSLPIARIYEDAVESGATEDRPAFSVLLRDLKDPRRGWSYLLVYDTSRIARRRYIAQALKFQAKKAGITLLYATRPADVDPISEIVLDSMLEAMDEVHSLMSRQKGLAGMAENVSRGWRAGGRAPIGYRLKPIETGALRDGRPVTKSKLDTGENADQVRGYLAARARGTPRSIARSSAGLDLSLSTLICMEWNALTYAGHTIWNVHREPGSGSKRRPRGEWHMRRDTHPALITDREAEALIRQLETSNIGRAVSAARTARGEFLLSGLLFSPDGRMWVGHGAFYRLKRRGDLPGRVVQASTVDDAVSGQLREILSTDVYLERLLAAAKRARVETAPGADIVTRITKLEKERTRAAERSLEGDDGEVYARLVTQRTRAIEALQRELEAVKREVSAGDDLGRLTVADVRELMREQVAGKAVRTLVERVMLDPQLACQMRMRAAPAGSAWPAMASPEGFDTWPPGLTIPIRIVG